MENTSQSVVRKEVKQKVIKEKVIKPKVIKEKVIKPKVIKEKVVKEKVSKEPRYYMDVIIKGDTHELNNVGDCSFTMNEHVMFRPMKFRAYVQNEFRDIVNSKEDIEIISFYKDKKVLFTHNYLTTKDMFD